MFKVFICLWRFMSPPNCVVTGMTIVCNWPFLAR